MIAETQGSSSSSSSSSASSPGADGQKAPDWNLHLDRAQVIGAELAIGPEKVARTLELLDGGATLPFIARYRKEVTGGLDEVQIGNIKERGAYLAELQSRKETILNEVHRQGKLSPALRQQIIRTLSKTELEDLYLPYKPKRRTRATIAREKGLEPLAKQILAQEGAAAPRDTLAAPFIDDEKDLPDTEAVFAGARDIVAEGVADTAEVRAGLRTLAMDSGIIRSVGIKPKDEDAPEPGNERSPSGGGAAGPAPGKDKKEDIAAKFSDYFDYQEAAKDIPSHRMLALRRGEKEGVLRVTLEVDRLAAIDLARRHIVKNPKAALLHDLDLAIADACDRLLKPAIEVDVRLALRERADAEAIRVFAENLRHLLLAPPLGGKRILALDPGYRTGCKLAIMDEKGDLKAHDVIYPTQSEMRRLEAAGKLEQLCIVHKIQAIAIGNGTGGRETEAFVRRIASMGKLTGIKIVMVNEAGASVYSASEVAREELPDQDVTVRGAVSIGRRLQDPLAELVKIEAKAIGVGQYQHDVHQPTLKKQLDQVVESCVNQVGVDLNTASPRLLHYVAGVGETLAKNIVEYRAKKGVFHSRQELLEVPRLGPKAFEQAAGFLRIHGAKDNPLDASAVHPESYDVVQRMASDLGVDVRGLIGNKELVARIDVARYVDDRRGEPTLRDILAELEKPGRDPRAEFEEVGFNPEVTEFDHVKEGMVLNGVITNVTNFGAFIDIGVHQDGLAHVSELAHRFVKDPAEVVKVGDRVKVKVVKVETDRHRIGLSIKAATEAPRHTGDVRPPRRTDDARPQAAPEARRPAPGGGGGGGGGDRRRAEDPGHVQQARRKAPPQRSTAGRPQREQQQHDDAEAPRDRGEERAPAQPATSKPFSTPFNQIRIRTK